MASSNKFLTLLNGIQNFVSGQQTSSGASAGLIPALNSSSFLDTSIGGTGLNGSSAADGDLLIGNGSGFSLAALTAGANITITPGSGSITIASAGSSSAYTPATKTANFSAIVQDFYSVDLNTAGANVTATLPDATASSGETLIVQASTASSGHSVLFATVSAQTINGSAAS